MTDTSLMVSRTRTPMLGLGLVAATLAAGLISLLAPGHASTHPAATQRPHTDLPAVTVTRTAPPAPTVVTKPRPAAKPSAPRATAAARPAKAPRRAGTPAKRTTTKPRVAAQARTAAVATRVESPTQRGMRVLTSLHYDWKRLGYAIHFVPGKAGYLGFTDGNTKTVTIYVRTTETDVVLAHTIAHELGHVLDFTHGNPAKHTAYLAARGINPTTQWYGCAGCTDYHSPAGDWAEVFAYYLAGPGDFRSEMGPPPTKVQMLVIKRLYAY